MRALVHHHDDLRKAKWEHKKASCVCSRGLHKKERKDDIDDLEPSRRCWKYILKQLSGKAEPRYREVLWMLDSTVLSDLDIGIG